MLNGRVVFEKGKRSMAYLRHYEEGPEEEKLRAQRALKYSEKFETRLPLALRPLVEMYLGATTLEAHDEFHGIKKGGDLALITQRCRAGCGGLWSASIEIACPYCKGTGKRR